MIRRPIVGITINRLEYIVDAGGNEMTFESEGSARVFLYERGYSDEMIEYAGIAFTDAI